MAPDQRPTVALFLLGIVGLILLAGCGGSAHPDPSPVPAPLSASDLNLIFVVSEDLAYNEPGDINPNTANLTDRGLQRALRMATFLQQNIMGGSNVDDIYALEPMTHLQTAKQFPDMVALETIQQFAMLNQTTLSYENNSPVTANSFPLNVSYSTAPVPDGVATPMLQCPSKSGLPLYNCQGLDFRDVEGANETLVGSIIRANMPGFYVFSAPWETISSLLAKVNQLNGYNLTLPRTYGGPGYIYAISIASSGSISLAVYNNQLNPPSNYPTLPPGGIVKAACLPATTKTTLPC